MSLICMERVFVIGAAVSVVVDATQHNSFQQGAEVQVVVRMRHVMTPCGIEYTLQMTRAAGNWPSHFRARTPPWTVPSSAEKGGGLGVGLAPPLCNETQRYRNIHNK